MSKAGWRSISLENAAVEIIDGDRGGNYPKQEEFFDEEYCLFLNTGNVTPNGFSFERTQFITKEKDDLLRKGRLKRNDIVLTTRGTVGNVAHYDNSIPFDNVRINSGMVVLRVADGQKELSAQYLYNFLNSTLFKEQILSHSSGSAQPQLPIKDLRQIELPLPPFETQHRIASIFSALDEKITLNRQTNATLEAIVQAIFKEWFVDFRFPGAIGDMQDSELGPIPKGWRVGKLGDAIDVKGGTTPSTKEEKYWNGEYHWVTPKDLSNLSSPVLLSTERRITKEGVAQISSGILPKGTLLLSSRAPIGYLAITDISVSINQGFIAINAKEVSNLFILHWLKENMAYVVSRANGSTFLEISKTNFKEIDLVIPDPYVIKIFDGIAKPIFEQIKINECQSITLLQIRDGLLPKLMNGEIDA